MIGVGILIAWQPISSALNVPNHPIDLTDHLHTLASHLPDLTSVFGPTLSPGEMNMTLSDYLQERRVDKTTPTFVTLINEYYINSIKVFADTAHRLDVPNPILVVCSSDECYRELSGQAGLMVYDGYHRRLPAEIAPPLRPDVNQEAAVRVGLFPWIKFNSASDPLPFSPITLSDLFS